MNSPKIRIHERNARGATELGWLKSKHTFSFGHFVDPLREGFRSLRVVNDDTVIPGGGFATHGHDNMEIISVVLDGALEHKDSMGTGSVISPGEIQKMSAGTGITHSEYNHSSEEPVHFYQIWIEPDEYDVAPSYEQITLEAGRFRDGFVLVGDRDAENGTISIRQDARMFIAMPDESTTFSYVFGVERYGFVQLASGQVTINGERLREGDGAEISHVPEVEFVAETDSQLLLFDLG